VSRRGRAPSSRAASSRSAGRIHPIVAIRRGLRARRRGSALCPAAAQRGRQLGLAVPEPPRRSHCARRRPAVALERGEQEHLQPFRFREGPPAQLFRDHALREVVGPLEIAALADGQLPARPQRRGHALHHAEVPPALARAPLPLHVRGPERSLVADAAAEIARDLRVLADEVPPPGMAAELAAAELEGRVQRERDPARLVSPVFEEGRPRPQQLLAHARVQSPRAARAARWCGCAPRPRRRYRAGDSRSGG
jgi:hypothetical protein